MGYTIELDLKDRLCLVLGGGMVATRKIKSLLKAHAKVMVVAPHILPLLYDLPITIKKAPFQKSFLEGVFLLICATDSEEVNITAGTEAKKRGILVNMASPPLELSDFSVPAVAEKEGLKISISTSGKSPELARLLRKKIESDIILPYALFLKTLGALRKEAQKIFPRSEERRDFWRKALTYEILALVEQKDIKQAEEKITHALNGYRS